MVDDFLRWPLPNSVCADLCATKQQLGRVGTNLLTAVEAKQMFEAVVLPKIATVKSERDALYILAKEKNEDAAVLKLLVSAGFITESKISEARAFLDEQH